MKSIPVFILLTLFVVGTSSAEELSIMGDIKSTHQAVNVTQEIPLKSEPQENSKSEEEGPADSLNSMKNYLATERKKQDEISGLTRDIQKYGLELQKKELLQKINEMTNKGTSLGPNTVAQPILAGHNEGQQTSEASMGVSYISISKNIKEALLTMEGSKFLASEGQVLWTGYTVKKINTDNVVLEDKSGNIITVMFNTMGL